MNQNVPSEHVLSDEVLEKIVYLLTLPAFLCYDVCACACPLSISIFVVKPFKKNAAVCF